MKTNLLEFQKNLNNQFFEVLNTDRDLTNNSENLGLIQRYKDINFFIPLKDLKYVSNKPICESPIKTKETILGFNDERGSVYTVFDFNLVLNEIFSNKEKIAKEKVEFNIIYLKSYFEDYFGLLINQIKLISLSNCRIIKNNNIKNEDLIKEISTKNQDLIRIVHESPTSVLIDEVYLNEKDNELFFVVNIKKLCDYLKTQDVL